MLQRIQSVFLVLAALCAGLQFVLPLARYERADQQQFTLTLTGLVTADATEVPDVALKLQPHLLCALLVALFLVTVFFFKNRPRQVRLVRFAYLLAVLLIVALWITHTSVQAYLEQNGRASEQLLPGFFLPFAAIVFGVLAERSIKKDEALVRSADRLR